MKWMFVMLAACGGAGNHGATPGLSKEDAVFEAVFLHDLATAKIPSDRPVCIVRRGATSDGTQLLAAMQAKFPNTVADSACTGGGPSGPVMVDGKVGVRLDAGPLMWMGDTQVRCDSGGAHTEGGVREVEYTLEKTSQGWKVTGEKLKMQT